MLFFVELYMKWTLFPTLKGSNQQKYVILESSRKCANGLFCHLFLLS
jgi:hypothetical protein